MSVASANKLTWGITLLGVYALTVSWTARADAPTDHYEIQGAEALDRGTGLRWTRDAAPGKYEWAQGVEYCRGLGPGWRLPSFKELLTLVDPTVPSPLLDPEVFTKPAAEDSSFWSMTADLGRSVAWQVNFMDGSSTFSNGGQQRSVRCVH
jgi:hypothetical protein